MATTRKVCFTGPTRLKVAEEILRGAGCELVMGKNQDDFREYKYPRRELVELIGDSASGISRRAAISSAARFSIPAPTSKPS